MTAILSKFTVLCISTYFVAFLFKLKLILFYKRVIYYNTKIYPVYKPMNSYVCEWIYVWVFDYIYIQIRGLFKASAKF